MSKRLRTPKQKHEKHKRAKQRRRPRRKNWLDYVEDDLDYIEDMPGRERMMPSAQSPVDVKATSKGLKGRVVTVNTGLYRVQTKGQELLCKLCGALSANKNSDFTNVIAVGDYVLVTPTQAGKGIIEKILPREGVILRQDPFYTHLRQILATNIDQVLIVASWRQPHLWTELIDRYWITAQHNHLEAVLCLNKIDLAEDMESVEGVLAPYRALRMPVIFTSATKGIGLDQLQYRLQGRTTVLVGLSGVGKSSLLSAVLPDFDFEIGEVNEVRGQGHHTTTGARMLPFGKDSYLIDTPGIREFGLVGLLPSELIAYYPDIATQARRCKFRSCTHTQEPDCAVQAAATNGLIHPLRLHNYQAILKSLSTD